MWRFAGRAFAAMWHHSGIEPQLPISVLRTESRHNLVLPTNLNKLATRDVNNRRTVLVEIGDYFLRAAHVDQIPTFKPKEIGRMSISVCVIHSLL
jgi:hypothetical protein